MSNVTTCDEFQGFTADGKFVILNRTERGVTQTLFIPVPEKDRRRLIAS